jgi:DNA modification methylase
VRKRHIDPIGTSIIYCGDCIEKLRVLPDACVDLIYIDPPFNSNQNYEVFWGETKEKRAFEDRHASTQAYIQFMRPRCVELHRVLKDNKGGFFYHCDWHASHYVKVMLDQIFGESGFRNEIVWHYGGRGAKAVAKQLPRNHDVILWYTKSQTSTYHKQFTQRIYTIAEAKDAGLRQDPDGRWFKTAPRGDYTDISIKALREEGRIHDTKSGGVRIKYHRRTNGDGDIVEDIMLGDVWSDIPDAMHMPKSRRLGYPTQKHPALLERIINIASDKEDIVLDAFCGCGTTLIAAEVLKRRWIGVDISPTACRVVAGELRKFCGLPEDEEAWRNGRGFVVRDLPWTTSMLRKIPHFEFENWAVIALGGLPNKAKVGDMGIDGRLYPVEAVPKRRGAETGEFDFMDEWYPIQVKQTAKVGRPDIDSFEAMMTREERKKGFFVAFDYTADALHEIDRFFRQSKRVIIPLTVKEILDEHIAHKLA